MNLTDTHSHLYEPEFDADREEALARAAEAGVERLLQMCIRDRHRLKGSIYDTISDINEYCKTYHHSNPCLLYTSIGTSRVKRQQQEIDRLNAENASLHEQIGTLNRANREEKARHEQAEQQLQAKLDRIEHWLPDTQTVSYTHLY